jgi:hypothetical protein
MLLVKNLLSSNGCYLAACFVAVAQQRVYTPRYNHRENRILNTAVYSQQLNILHNDIGIYRKLVLLWEQWYIYGAAGISGYIAASGTVDECVIWKDFEGIFWA